MKRNAHNIKNEKLERVSSLEKTDQKKDRKEKANKIKNLRVPANAIPAKIACLLLESFKAKAILAGIALAVNRGS